LITPHDVPASKLIEKTAKYLKENVDAVTPPAWSTVAKTGSHVEKQPQNPDWWYTRSASLLRKVYVHGPIGLERLRAEYGGQKGFTVTREHAFKAGGSNIRKVLQQLETAGLVEITKPKGRKITKEGRKLLQELAEEIAKDMPELSRYKGD